MYFNDSIKFNGLKIKTLKIAYRKENFGFIGISTPSKWKINSWKLLAYVLKTMTLLLEKKRKFYSSANRMNAVFSVMQHFVVAKLQQMQLSILIIKCIFDAFPA